MGKFEWFAVIVIVVALLVLALLPADAHAYPMACRSIPHGARCVSSTNGLPLISCDRGYSLSGWRCVKAPSWYVPFGG